MDEHPPTPTSGTGSDAPLRDGLLILRTDGELLEASLPGWPDAFRPEELARHILAALSPATESEGGTPRLLEDAAARGLPPTHIHHDETDRRLELTLLPLSPDHDAPRIACHLRDVSERQDEDTVCQRLLGVVENASDLIGYTDAEGHLQYLNRNARRALGIDLNAAPAPRDALDFHPAWAQQKIREQAFPAADRNGIWIGESAILFGNGQEVPVMQIILSHRDASGEIHSRSLIARDISEARIANDERAVSELHFRGLFETISSGVAIYEAIDDGTDFRLVDLNPAGCRIVGAERDEVCGKRVTDIFPNVQEMGLMEVFRQAYRSGRPGHLPLTEYEDSHLHRWVENRVFRLPDKMVFAIFDDMTLQRQADAELRATRAQLLAAIECSTAGIIIADAPDGTIRHVNTAALSIRGGSPETLSRIDIPEYSLQWNTLHLDGQPYEPHDLPLARAIQNGERVANEELLIRRDDGEDRHVLANAAPVRDESGAITAGIAVFLDITTQRRMEEQIRRSEKRFRALADATQEGVFLQAAAGIVLVNATGANLFGYDSTDALDRQDFLDRVSPECKDIVAAEMRQPTARSLEVICLRQDGSRFPAEVAIRSLTFHGEMVSAIALNDISRRKGMEEELLHSEKMRVLGQLAGGIAHDFNNILSGISGTAEMIEILDRQKALSETQLTNIDQILSLCDQAADLTSKLLTFSRKHSAGRQRLDINQVLQDARAILTRVVDKRITIDLLLADNLPTVLGDASALQNALMNLTVNARDSMPDGGSITFHSRLAVIPHEIPPNLRPALPDGTYVVIEVTDTGPGIPAAIMDRIFEPFFTTKEAGKGTGLGLSATYGMAESHGGGIAVSNLSEGGARFSLYLPVGEDDAPAPSDSANEGDTHPADSLRVLVVDDEAAIRLNVSQILAAMGHEIETAANGREAVDLVTENPDAFDLVLMDLVMPVLAGRPAFSALRQLRPGLPIVIMSGFSHANELHHMQTQPRTEFLRKPFRTADLSAAIAAVLKED